MKNKTLIISCIILLVCIISALFLSNKQLETKPILGVIIPLTGPVAPIAEGLRNTIDITPVKNIKIEYADDACDAKKALSAYQQLKLKGVKVFYIACSASILSIEPLAKKNNDLILTTYAFSSDIRETGDDVIRFIPDALDVFGAMKNYFNSNPSESYAILYENGTYESLVKNLQSLLGDKILTTQAYNSDAIDIRTQVAKVKASGAKSLIFLPVGDKIARSAFEQMKILGMNLPIIGEFNVCDYTFKAADFGLSSVCWKGQLNNEAAQKFGANYKAKFGIENQYPFFDQVTYDSVIILDRLVKNNSINDESVNNIKKSILTGVTGEISSYTFEPNGKLKDGDKFLVQVNR